MKKDLQFIFDSIYAQSITNHLDEVAQFRIKYFCDFPYLYEGNFEYEKDYLQAYAQDDQSLLIKINSTDGELVGVSTALPLVTPSDILTDAPEQFRNLGYDPHDIYYYGEIILDYSIRRKGFAKQIYELQGTFARNCGFSKIAIATVVRDERDPQRPKDYQSSDLIWESLGFEKTSISFNYQWPTIQLDGSVEEIDNPMVYWIKNL